YLQWAEKNNFTSMLPKDAEKHHNDAAADKQSHLDPHLREKLQKERVIPYDDDLFHNAAIEWLVSNVLIQAFEHPTFQNMNHLAAHATNGVKI
ncbi:hypothetical protein L208DRAFT_1217987, partial [Tricholoma matsutake]